jgi:SAM-dependent methyltransferase
MNDPTANRLNQINLRFYEWSATSFSETRNHAWSGWFNLIGQIPLLDPLRVLDIGCGNGRFLGFLHSALGDRVVHYTGVDASETLLEEAGRQFADIGGARWERVDLFEEPGLEAWAPGQVFDLVVAFGVFHHIPGSLRRARLLNHLHRRLSPGGLLVITLWRFHEKARFENRILDWETFNTKSDRPLDLDQLERNDFLLGWKNDPEAVRYCHAFDDQERDALIQQCGILPFHTFRADGKSGDLNEYLLFREPGAPSAAAT